MAQMHFGRPDVGQPDVDQTADVLIVGGGVCGTALLFELARYTDLGSILLVERYDALARVNSKATNNSQTIHCGDIETNYTLEKAVRVKRTAEMIVNYAELLDPASRERCVFRTPKMVLGVGERECTFLRERFDRFSPHFPAMELLEKPQIAEWEPQVGLVQGELRPEELVAIGIRRTYTAVDYEELSASFVAQGEAAVAGTSRQLTVQLGTSVVAITPEGDGYRVELAPTPGCSSAAGEAPRSAAFTSRQICFGARFTPCRTTSCPLPPSTATRTFAPLVKPVLALPPCCCRCWSATSQPRFGSF